MIRVSIGKKRSKSSWKSMSDVFYNDMDPYVCKWIENLIAKGHLPKGDVQCKTIQELKPDELREYRQVHLFVGIGGWPLALKLAGWPEERLVWTGSCPCPPFSSSGPNFTCPKCEATSPVPCPRRVGFFICWYCENSWFADARHLWPEMWALIAELRPPTVFGEQVASADGRVWLSGVQASLEILGFDFAAADLCAAGVSAPHIRQRIFWLANSSGLRRQDALPDRSQNAQVRERQRIHRPQMVLEQIGDSEPWRSCRALHCDDGKRRRIPSAESGIFPLAYGLSQRVGRLRAYGNAIVPQVAAEFVKSFLESDYNVK